MRYFHGGVRGLKVGDMLLPPTVTGVESVLDYAAPEDAEEASRVGRRDRVFLSTNMLHAAYWASLWPGGTKARGGDVYEAEPVGDVEDDLDFLGTPGVSVHASAARVVKVVERRVPR